jgi:beta-galactosidase
LYDQDINTIVLHSGNSLGLAGEYEVGVFCDLIHAETATILATYKDDFYANRPALTINEFGKGQAYYIASRNEECFLKDFYGVLTDLLDLNRALEMELPEGVTIQMRSDGEKQFLFFLNFSEEEHTVNLGKIVLTDMVTGERVSGKIVLPPYGVKIGESLKV